MKLEEKAEEILETLWSRTEEETASPFPLDEFGTDNKPIEELLNAGYISISENRVSLTSTGRPEAMKVVRRHRLAERLLTDVLGTADRLTREKACKFEHLLDRGLDESICILLGHPKVCPHGKPIPPGRCCQKKEMGVPKIVAPLSRLAPGQKGEVAYIYAPESNKLQRLMGMGILPGVPVTLIQSFPSYVFQTRQTQFAVDKEIADAIYVRLKEEETTRPTVEPLPGRRRRWGWRARGLGWGWLRGKQ